MESKVKTWFDLATGDLEFAGEILAAKKRPHYSAHFCQQAIEKLLKAIVQKRTGKAPLPVHNLKTLCNQAKLELPDEKMQWLLNLAPHYLGARYPEDLFELQKQYTQAFSERLYKETQEIFEWLRKSYLK